ncbi:DegV family protein [Isobaculum melis]|uniref:DhaL domain-containing protein n=1 Tax=Isobaculum melis TaxID=142588 RepID=A0A1H9Q5J3_9LACT|nr:DegV family protein [Isobaculum melis]SER55720.1 hypothetical protein SAMN04488559_101358 [Isobaculum melis]
MEINSTNQTMDAKKLVFAFRQGAIQLISGKQELNQINVFPVSDGDTGSNLASLMQTILEETNGELTSAIEVFEKVADASLVGARGNSGIIFAQYFNGIYNNLLKCEERNTIGSFVKSVKLAIVEAYQAIEKPVEGTIVTVISSWAEALNEKEATADLTELLQNALTKAKQALENTTKQLKILKKNQVVDAGAKGFYLFIDGFTKAFLGKIETDDTINLPVAHEQLLTTMVAHSQTEAPTFRYCTEVLLEQVTATKEEIQQALSIYGDSMIVAVNRGKARIHIHSNQPDQVLAYLASVGQPMQQKADDMLLQYQVNQHKKAQIALVTDSIADLPADYLLANQIHVLPMNLLIGKTSYLDKITVQSDRFFELQQNSQERVTSSQPSLKTVENLFSFLETKYEAILVVTVAEKLSGAYHTVCEAAKRRGSSTCIEVIDSKLNSAAQGLLVMNVNEWIQEQLPFDEIVKRTNEKRAQLKIFVSVTDLDPMIATGRIPQFAGEIAKKIHAKPIVSLDAEGHGKLSNVAFSLKGNQQKVRQQLKKIQKQYKIKRYAVIHGNAPEQAQRWSQDLTEVLGMPPTYIMPISAVIAMSAGQGSVAVAVDFEEGEVR